MSTRPAAVPDSISGGTWDVVVGLVAALDPPALARLIATTTAQVQTAGTPTALDASLTLLLAATDEAQRRADPSGDPERWRTVACYAASGAITAGAAARTARVTP